MSDFFEAGKEYEEDTDSTPFRAPEVRERFRCVAVADHPITGDLRAFGFHRRQVGARWDSYALRAYDWERGWREVTP